MSVVLDRPSSPPAAPRKGPDPAAVLRAALDRFYNVRWFTAVDASIMIGLLAVVLIVQGVNIAGYPAVGDDEGTYLAQAWALQNGHGLAHYTYWYDHPPVGWIQIAALSWIPDLLMPAHLTVAHARVVMLPVTVVSVCLLYVFGRRMQLPRWAAAVAGLLYVLSPLAVTLQRQIYLDNIAMVWMLAAFVLALSPKRHLWHHVSAGICAAVSILSKETMVVVLPALVLALWQGSHPSTRKFSIVGFATMLGLVGILYPLYALLNNELVPGPDHVSLLGGILFQLQRVGSGSFLDPTSGSRAIVNSWLYYDNVVIVAGLVAAAIAVVALKRLRAPAIAVLLLLVMAMRPGYLPAMYVIQALPFLALSMAGVAAAAVHLVLTSGTRWHAGVGRYLRVGVVAVAVVAAATYVVPRWAEGDQVAMTRDANVEFRAVVSVLAAMPHDHKTKVLVDDAIWLDLVKEGYEPGQGAIWFYKLDLDPAVHLDNGWRDVDYVVASPIVRESMRGLPTVMKVLESSTVVQTFGTGEERIELRKVDKTR